MTEEMGAGAAVPVPAAKGSLRYVHLAGDATAVAWVASLVEAGPSGPRPVDRETPVVWVAWADGEVPADPAIGSLPCLLVVPPGGSPPDLGAGRAWSGPIDFVRQPEDATVVATRLENLLVQHSRRSRTEVLLDNIQDAIFCRSLGGAITSLNAAAALLFAGTRETLPGRHFVERTGDPAAASAWLERSNRLVLATGRARERIRLRTVDGRLATFDTDSLLLRDARGAPCGVQVSLSDVTLETAARERLEREAERNEILADIASATRDSLEPGKVLPSAAEILGRRVGANTVEVWSVDEARTAACVEHQWRSSETHPSLVGYVRRLAESVPFRGMVQAFEPYVVRDRQDLEPQAPESDRILERVGARAVLGFPLRHGSELLGILGVSFAEPRDFSHDELVFFERVADQFALAVRTARLFASLRAQVEALTEAQRRREEAEQDRQRLSAMLVHDLKNPLSAILASLDLTLERVGTADERTARMLRTSIASARALQGLIEDALLVYRPEEAPLPARVAALPGDVLSLALAEAAYLADSRRIALRAQVQPGLPRLLVDAPRLRRAAANLLTNALKFSPPGSEVTAFLRLEEKEGVRWLVFGVSDGGPGLPEAARARLATPYARFTGSEETPGTGLGLAVVHRVAREHGGRLEALPNDDGRRGSLFVLRIPAVDP